MAYSDNNNILYYLYIVLYLFLIFSGISISISQLLLGIEALLFIFAYYKDHNTYYKTGIEKYFIAFIGISVILALLSPNIINNLDYLKDFWLISAFIIVCSIIKLKEDIQKIIYLLIFIVIFQSFFDLLQNFFNINLVRAFVYGIAHYKAYGMNSGFRGGFLGMHLVFSCYLMFISLPLVYISFIKYNYSKKWIPWLIRLAAVFAVIVLFITKSRSILIALPFSVIPLFFLKKKISFILILLLATAVIGIFSFSGPGNTIKQNLSGNIYNSDTAYDRFKIWKTVFHIWLKHPIIGSGGGNYLNEFRQVLKEHPELDVGMVTHAHNDYLNQLARKGIIGFFAFIYMLYGIFRYMVVNLKYIQDKLLKYLYLGIFGAYCSFLVASLFQCFYTDEENLVMLWFSIGLLTAIVKVEKGNVTGEIK